MTPDEIKTFFEGLIDDSPDVDVTYNLMDTAYTKRNESRSWQMLMKLDTSITHNPSDTWQTEKTLPTDFGRPHKVFGGASDNEYDGVPFEDMLKFMQSPSKFTIDIANLKMRFLGAPSSALTVYFYYFYVPTALIGLSAPQKFSTTTIVWPSRFRKLLAYDMANSWLGGIDNDEFNNLKTPYQKVEARELQRAMENWDTKNKMRLKNNSASESRGVSNRADVLDW